MKQRRNEALERGEGLNILLLDTGDALIGGGRLGDKTKGEVIVQGMNKMFYDAMALGPNELSLGPDVLGVRLGEAHFYILSANAVNPDTGELVAAPYMVKEVGNHRVGIIGLTRVPSEPRPGFEVLDPAVEVARYVAEVQAQADTLILLTNMNYEQARELASQVPGIDLVIASRPDQLPDQAVRTPDSGALIVVAEQPKEGHTGRRMGWLEATLGPDGSLGGETWQSVWLGRDIPDDNDMRILLDTFRQ